ncbi:hypothetical protein [Streptomyces sp. A0642]|uniref:hypothetical protein n=1 Tax=Streptomyces sp. A0642 TaxID=2563100 RepID=UPI001444B1F9|nr:hypothetical protein [Streptomyces sp. A0642]
MPAGHPAVDPAEAAAAYQRAQDLMRAEAERRRAVDEATADARAAAANAAAR